MKKKTKQIIIWSILVVLAIITILIIYNMDGFLYGLREGGALAE
ncbi:MAG: hypothetical protein VB022_07240 [Rikenellaceae bacterium]|nr:hypothetical protein [Rikenellaceae bacterium]